MIMIYQIHLSGFKISSNTLGLTLMEILELERYNGVN